MNSIKTLVVLHRPIYPPLYGYSKLILDTYIALSKLGVDTYILSINPRSNRIIKIDNVIYREISEPKFVFMKLSTTRLLLRISGNELFFMHLLNLFKNYSADSIVNNVDKIVTSDFGKPDIIISETIYPSALAQSLSKKYSSPLIIRTHNIESEYVSSLSRVLSSFSHKFISKVERKALATASRIITISSYDTIYIKEHYGLTNVNYIPPIIIVEKPVDSDKYLLKHGLIKNKFFIYVASPHKPNIDFLKNILKCNSILKKHGYKLVISGSISNIATKYVEKMGLENTVVTGILPSDELYGLISNSYVSLAPHHGSGVPIKLVEALALKTPVITTQNALKTINGLKHCENIYAVESISKICYAIEELIVNKEIYSKIQSNVEKISKTLDYRILAEKYLATIKSVLEK